MTSVLASTAASAAKAAHAGAASLLSAAQVKVGATIPSSTVKEDDPQAAFSLGEGLTGKNIIVDIFQL